MKEIKINVYEFNELNENIQEKLIEQEKEAEKEIYLEYFLYEDISQKATELLRKYFKDKAEFSCVYYDLSYSQGSGAMVEFNLKYYNKNITIKQHGNYTHERSFIFDYNDIYNNYAYLTDKQEEKLKEKIIKINKELTKFGYSLIETDFTDKEIYEKLSMYTYFKNGERVDLLIDEAV